MPVHLVDTGPRHEDVAVHPVHEGERYFAPYVHPTERPGFVFPEVMLSEPWRDASIGLNLAADDPAGTLIWSDCSVYQSSPYNAAYGRRFASYRVSLSTTTIDAKVAASTAWCSANAGPGKQMFGHMGYLVWYPGNEAAQVALFLAHADVDASFVAMIDVESWSGAIKGDHSASIMIVANLLAAKLGQARVKLYANAGDKAAIAPNVAAWLGDGIARYSSSPPTIPHQFWQYTDGSTTYPVPSGWPRTSAPFGACDHNAFQGTAAQFIAAFGLPTGTPQEDDMFVIADPVANDNEPGVYVGNLVDTITYIPDLTSLAMEQAHFTQIGMNDAQFKTLIQNVINPERASRGWAPYVYNSTIKIWQPGPLPTPAASTTVNATVDVVAGSAPAEIEVAGVAIPATLNWKATP